MDGAQYQICIYDFPAPLILILSLKNSRKVILYILGYTRHIFNKHDISVSGIQYSVHFHVFTDTVHVLHRIHGFTSEL